ncbi:permease [Paenibacillus guangzhouensis]|uniref:permease n=1 Tax=Paenibacillus guangzhouensis TaxID=1473112 RepID=UPI001266F7B0|nr:permease [Paenibacillus guangzhouensis]
MIGFLNDFRTMVIGILLESFPFVLIGVILSALLQTFVSDQTLQRFIPKRTVTGILFGCLLGIVFPLCECGLIPVVHRLIRKGMPPYIGIVFMMAGPVINPVVYASTYVAFQSHPEVPLFRILLAFAAAAVIGLWAAHSMGESALRTPSSAITESAAAAVSQSAKRKQHRMNQAVPRTHWLHQLHETLEHAAIELFDVGKFLVLGATITALLQTVVSRQWMLSLGEGEGAAHLFMMALSYILSICSTADAFVAVTFSPDFSFGSLLAFLVFGAMFDIKSTLMLLKVFRAKTVFTVMAMAAVVILVGSILVDQLYY